MDLTEYAHYVMREEDPVLLAPGSPRHRLFRAVEDGLYRDGPRLITVTGGPGSGKTCDALALLRCLSDRQVEARYVSGSRPVIETMRHHIARGSRRLQARFGYPNTFRDAEPAAVEVLICDDAQLLRASSANRFTPAARRKGPSQLVELAVAAHVVVLLFDERAYRPAAGRLADDIDGLAAATGTGSVALQLAEQFRHGGRAYTDWVDRLLDPANPLPEPGSAAGLGLRVAASPGAMEDQLAEAIATGGRESARISAGYCWPAASQHSGPDADEGGPVVGDWARPWPNPGRRPAAGRPPGGLWMVRAGGFGQVGTVHHSYGLEVAEHGVIIGPDLLIRDGRLRTDPAASCDPVVQRLTAAEADRYLRGAYRRLLTRAKDRTLVCATDPHTQAHLTAATE